MPQFVAVMASATAVLLCLVSEGSAAGVSEQIATKGQPLLMRPEWPSGTVEFLNGPHRGDGWNSWFSEWPSDVQHYAFSVSNIDELNEVIAQFATIDAPRLKVRLTPQAEPRSFGWVGRLPEGNEVAAVFSIGDQQLIDAWYKRLPAGKFGQMEFTKTPEAVPPTLTIFVRNKAMDMHRLLIPESVEVAADCLPSQFEEWNLREDDSTTKSKVAQEADTESNGAVRDIEAFLLERRPSGTR